MKNKQRLQLCQTCNQVDLLNTSYKATIMARYHKVSLSSIASYANVHIAHMVHAESTVHPSRHISLSQIFSRTLLVGLPSHQPCAGLGSTSYYHQQRL